MPQVKKSTKAGLLVFLATVALGFGGAALATDTHATPDCRDAADFNVTNN